MLKKVIPTENSDKMSNFVMKNHGLDHKYNHSFDDMLRLIIRFMALFFSYVLVGILQKPLFMLVHGGMSATALSASDWWDVVIHGLPMDCTVAAYFTSVPALMMLIETFVGHRPLFFKLERIWFIISAVLLAAIVVLDLGLYASWGFRLDMSPVFYFTTSPKAAMASVTPGQMALAGIGLSVIALLIFVLLRFGADRFKMPDQDDMHLRRRVSLSVVALLLTAALFLPIRGGLTVSTMNLSRSYYSSNTFLNHAAVNPFFSLFYSATHQERFGEQFRFMSAEDADEVFDRLRNGFSERLINNDSLLNTLTPDIYIVLLESFSAELFPSLGGENIAQRLDSVARDGILFANFYSNSFRTDRGIPAVLSGFPGAPTASLMKFVEKTSDLPSIASELGKNGWVTSYYYGGDINFTNMLAYLINAGFTHTVCDKDFPLSERTGKWGAHDHLLFGRVLDDIKSISPDAPPQLTVIQTSSSHEPFEVPYNKLADKRVNSFAYADSCAGAFLDSLRKTSRYDRSLVILVPDHFGVYPHNLSDPERRHHIPLILTGGALSRRGTTCQTVGSQVDIAPTLMTMLNIDAAPFRFGTDMLAGDSAGHYAFFSEPSFLGMIDADGNKVVISLDTTEVIENTSVGSDTTLVHAAKAYIQKIYDFMSAI